MRISALAAAAAVLVTGLAAGLTTGSVSANAALTAPTGSVVLTSLPSASGSITTTSFENGSIVPDASNRQIGFRIDSVSVPDGLAVALYNQASFGGVCLDLHASTDNLSALSDTVRSLTVGQDCDRTPAGAATVQLCDHGGCPSSDATLVTQRNIPNLIQSGFNDRASSVQLNGAYSAALYADIGYRGVCETITNPKERLDDPGDTVGDNQTSSIRINATCFGPVFQPPVIQDLDVVNSPTTPTLKCPDRYTKVPQDLNQGVGGDFVYLCLKYEPFKAGMAFLNDLDAFNVGSRAVQCGNTSYIFMPQDLNVGAGGDFVYFCKRSVNLGRGDRQPKTGTMLEQAWFVVDPDFLNNDDACRASAASHISGGFNPAFVTATRSDRDLNSNFARPLPNAPFNHPQIFTCIYKPSPTQQSLGVSFRFPTHLDAVGRQVSFHAEALLDDGQSLPTSCHTSGGQSAIASSGYLHFGEILNFGDSTMLCTATDPTTGQAFTSGFPVTLSSSGP